MSKSCLTAVLSFFIFFNVIITEPGAQSSSTTVSGTIVRNARRCAMDGICFLEVQKLDGSVVQIYYGWEMLPADGIKCQADNKLSDLAWSLKPGQIVEIRGQFAQDGKTILLCTNQNHYLNVMSTK